MRTKTKGTFKLMLATITLATVMGSSGTLYAAPLQSESQPAQIRTGEDLSAQARKALSPHPAEAASAIKILREAGKEGLGTLVIEHQDLLERCLKLSPQERAGHPEWKRLKNALDQTGAQCDNWASKLYWFTDLEKAKAEAQKQNKPILSLRLLGNLDDELSCANSRFFRTALYPNARINEILYNKFILHWQSVRPVPKVTIDFGDGRKIQTTITGNSVHYVLNSEGKVFDALPGLYGPGAFARWLETGDYLFRSWTSPEAGEETRREYFLNHHRNRREQLAARWSYDLAKVGVDIQLTASKQNPPVSTKLIAQQSQPSEQAPMTGESAQPVEEVSFKFYPLGDILGSLPTARRAENRTVAKAVVESSLMRGITVSIPRDRTILKDLTDDATWSKIAEIYAGDAKLDENSLKVLRAKTMNADQATFNFQKSIAEDSVRNEYSRHAVIHQWLMENPGIALDTLNKKVYAELFLTPDSDPWLGLLPADAYTALQNNGVTTQ